MADTLVPRKHRRTHATSFRWPALALSLVAVPFLACGDEVIARPGGGDGGASAGGAGGAGGTGAAGGGSGWGFEELTVDWVPCSLMPGANDGLAECADVAMPLRWGEAGGEFHTYAKRLLSQAPQAEGQLWLLHGGPGGSGTVGLPAMMQSLQSLYPELDLYTLDARGTGWSEWLGCPQQEDDLSDGASWITLAELDACIAHVQAEYGERLSVYTPTQAAIDLAAFIYNTREDGKRLLIWGGSGGTFWAQRYLQLFPDQADGVVIEGIVPPDESLVFQDEYDDLVARRILEMCAADPYCSSKLPDPVATLLGLFEKLDGGHCSSLGIDTVLAKQLIRSFDYYYPTHLFTPAFIYRLDRCDPGDEDAIYQLYTLLWGEPEPQHSFSTVLFFNEGWSELWEHHFFANNGELVAYLDEVQAGALVAFGMGQERNQYYLKWPRYEEPLDDTWASSAVPMLMLQGQIDPSTPHDFAEAVGQHFTGPHQHWVSFPYATHNVHNGSPMGNGPAAEHCGTRLFIDFLRDPEGDLDTSCVAQTVSLDFEGAEWAPYLTGTADFFENDPPAAAALATTAPRLPYGLSWPAGGRAPRLSPPTK